MQTLDDTSELKEIIGSFQEKVNTLEERIRLLQNELPQNRKTQKLRNRSTSVVPV
ncbi:MAG: hypothetical protein R2874_02840 [Desulfobacterales bacterium]